MRKKYFYLLIILVSNFFLAQIYAYKALCIVPVADLVGEPFEKINPQVNIIQAYKNIAISGEKGPLNCNRIHQMLFNEIAEVIEEYTQEVKIKISTIFHLGPHKAEPNHTFFTLKQNLLPVSTISVNNNLEFLPEPIDFNKTTFEKFEKKVITLILPFYDSETKQIYSAGTRFIISEQDENYYTVAIYDNNLKKFAKSKISKKIAIEPITESRQKKIENFVELLKLWANLENQIIPYVWGGISMQQLNSKESFDVVNGKNCMGQDIVFYNRHELEAPYTGFDCSGLIARATQICQIPYFYKNTTTLAACLKPIQMTDDIQNGDLIWLPGHVVVITDIKNNICVEARGYGSGFGQVHQIALNKLFKDVNNIQDLKTAYFENKPLELLNKSGNVSLIVKAFKVLKLSSIWG